MRGFTLIECTMALAILAMTLAVLMEVQASSLNNAGRARNLSIGALLARGKMIDVEKTLFDEGFTTGEQNEEGDFKEEGHPDYHWKYTVSELDMDLSGLGSLCGGFAKEEAAQGDCESMLGGLGGSMDAFADEMEKSLRLVELTVSWPDGRLTESMSVRGLVTRTDFNLTQDLPPGMPPGSMPPGSMPPGMLPPGNPLGGPPTWNPGGGK